MTNVSVKGGTLLLDPKNITVDGSSGSGSLSSGLRAQVYPGYFNDNLSFFGTVGGSSQHTSSSIRNRFVNDFSEDLAVVFVKTRWGANGVALWPPICPPFAII